ncbi:MAG: NAD(+) synthase [Clostridiales bacterium]|nr:NAD(+) synthase [Clostridiales bacterium]
MKDGFLRAGAATPEVKVADVDFNVEKIIAMVKEAENNNCSLLVFPELSITGYTCQDLFLQDALITKAYEGLERIVEETADINVVFCVGLPLKVGDKLYNVAAAVFGGEILGFVPKQNVPNYGEFYELRHFEPFIGENMTVDDIPFGRIVFENVYWPDFTFGIEICEDLWVKNAPSDELTSAGAMIIANLSASDEVIGKASYRKDLIKIQSAKCLTGYIYSDCGFGESTQDMVFAGHNLIFEDGRCLAETKPFGKPGIVYADIDIKKLSHERQKITTYYPEETDVMVVEFEQEPADNLKLIRKFSRTPFVPSDDKARAERCELILTMQAEGLATRLDHVHGKKAVIGLSGGLDSTLALIVTIHAFDRLGLDRKGIIAVTMPCFGTTSRTKNNSVALANAYGVTIREINIAEAVTVHFRDIGQSPDVHDVTYENSQARERTQVIMDIANKEGGIVIGTGDLSELALGWATYNGDHMSMYAVNASIPKTLVRYLVSYEADRVRPDEPQLAEVLDDIFNTPVSPELLPPTGDGQIAQKTEELVGPYELHDFFLYYMVRLGYSPSKIYRIAVMTFEGTYTPDVIYKWEETFIRRFFSQQFKRSCLPDGPKVGTVTLSPRGDWRMPSDAAASLWLSDLKTVLEE